MSACVAVPLENGGAALVDFDDLLEVCDRTWYRVTWCKKEYVTSIDNSNHKSKRWVSMHRLLMGPGDVDHINGDGLDNRRNNLRHCTRSQNQANRKKMSSNKSGFKGVVLAQGKYWRATISPPKGKQLHIGYFPTAEAAARAYDIKAIELYGEFACPNFSESRYLV